MGEKMKGGGRMLGARIAALRRGKGWSQAELAERLKISPSAVGMYEQGRREPALDLLVELARLFGVSVDYLLTGQVTPGQERQDVEVLIDAALRQTQEQLRGRKRPFSRQELAVLFAALLMEEPEENAQAI